MKFYLNNLTNIDVTWFEDERIKKDDTGDYLENMEDYEWYKKIDWAMELLEYECYVYLAGYLEKNNYINEWSDYIYYATILENTIKKRE